MEKDSIYGEKISKYVLVCRRDHDRPHNFSGSKRDMASTPDIHLNSFRVVYQNHTEGGILVECHYEIVQKRGE